MTNILRIAWIAIRELLYERVFYLLAMFCVLSLGLSLLLGQLSYAEQSKLTLDFMLGGIEVSMILFSVFMGIALFKREMTMGSISMVLSKPVSRTSFLLGKYCGQITVQFVVTAAMAAFTVLVCTEQQTGLSTLAIFQSALMTFFEISVLTSITYCFAVNAGVITTAIATLCLFGLGHLEGFVGETLKSTDFVANAVLRGLRGLLPNLELFNMKALASYGHSIPWNELGFASLYALCCIAFFLMIASVTFNQKDILT